MKYCSLRAIEPRIPSTHTHTLHTLRAIQARIANRFLFKFCCDFERNHNEKRLS